MSGSSFGKIFRFTNFGESHSQAIGGVIEGCPSGLSIDFEHIRKELEKRRPTDKSHSTKRQEKDEVEFLSGIENGISLGSPIAYIIPNKDIIKEDYHPNLFRPSHGDYSHYQKYGIISSSGGGRSSARETASRVVAGSIAKQILRKHSIEVKARVVSIGGLDYIEEKQEIDNLLNSLESIQDSVGGVIEVKGINVMPGLGEPVFDKLDAVIAMAMMSIPGAKAVEIGGGFELSNQLSSNSIDHWTRDFKTKTNNSGGIQGGISNGMDIIARVGFKPPSSIGRPINHIDPEGSLHLVETKGRHDRSYVERAQVIVESMLAITLVDFLLRNQSSRLESND